MKKALCILLTFLMCFSLIACQSEQVEEPKVAECTPLLYKVTDGKGATLYLLGSIHVGDKRTQAMPDYVMNAYNA